jgi:hypothetical protein
MKMAENSKPERDYGVSSPFVYTIILNYNNYPDTVKTLESVFSQDYETNSILLVENSTDLSIVQRIRIRFPDLDIIKNEKNLGYAGGNNRGIQEALNRRADYIFLLNNDVILETDVLRKCVEGMEKAPDCAACQPLIAYLENMTITWSAGTQFFLGYPRLFQKGTKLERNGIRESPYGLVGCAILFRKSAFEEIGPFDESLFLMQEESDWCIRARKRNYSLLIVSSAVVYHKVSATIGLFSKSYLYYIGRNWLLVGKKNFDRLAYLYIIVTEVFVRFPYYLLQLTKTGQISLIRYYLKGIKDGILGISGEVKI